MRPDAQAAGSGQRTADPLPVAVMLSAPVAASRVRRRAQCLCGSPWGRAADGPMLVEVVHQRRPHRAGRGCARRTSLARTSPWPTPLRPSSRCQRVDGSLIPSHSLSMSSCSAPTVPYRELVPTSAPTFRGAVNAWISIETVIVWETVALEVVSSSSEVIRDPARIPDKPALYITD